MPLENENMKSLHTLVEDFCKYLSEIQKFSIFKKLKIKLWFNELERVRLLENQTKKTSNRMYALLLSP